MFTLADLPFKYFLICIVAIIGLLIFGSLKERKKDPNNLLVGYGIWIIIPVSVMFVFRRYVNEVNPISPMVKQFVEIAYPLVLVLFFIALGVILCISYKRGHADEEKTKILKSLLPIWVIIIVICVMVLSR